MIFSSGLLRLPIQPPPSGRPKKNSSETPPLFALPPATAPYLTGLSTKGACSALQFVTHCYAVEKHSGQNRDSISTVSQLEILKMTSTISTKEELC